MSHSSDRSLGDDGVSEVVSFILGFFMAFIILVTTLYAFSQINASARELSAEAEARDIANRVALGVQEAFTVASARNDTQASIASTTIRFNRTLTVPETIQGWRYEVSLDTNFVNATVLGTDVSASVPTFKLAVELPATPAQCSAAVVLCAISGTASSGAERFVVSYQFNGTASPILNEIRLA